MASDSRVSRDKKTKQEKSAADDSKPAVADGNATQPSDKPASAADADRAGTVGAKRDEQARRQRSAKDAASPAAPAGAASGPRAGSDPGPAAAPKKGADSKPAVASKDVADAKPAADPKGAAPASDAPAADAKPAAGKGQGKPGEKVAKGKPGKAKDGATKVPAAAKSKSADDSPDKSAESDEPVPPRRPADRRRRFILFAAVPSWLISLVVHVVLLLVLALITFPEKGPLAQIMAVSDPNEVPEQLEEFDEEEIDPVDVEKFTSDAPAEMLDTEAVEDDVTVPEFTDMDAAPQHIELQDFGTDTAPRTDMSAAIGAFGGTGLEGRGARARKAMVRKYGGNEGSEAAVVHALHWLAAHQENDGGWSFDHTRGPCKGRCTHPGLGPPSRNGATAMALLPFLGAGQTHKEGKYKSNVERGLAFLVRHMKVKRSMGDLRDPGGNMYSHGLATITLCEAYAMTNDPGLLQPAQLAVNFIVYAQDPVGGGWRYRPKQEGDTSVVGWQLMALKSAHMAYLKVPHGTIQGVTRFLDFVQDDNGAKYGYTVPASRPSTTAVGLLCRMYLGWKKDKPALKAGVAYLHEVGPTNDMYYNYYATQIMRHFGGKSWEDWNSKLRDKMTTSQDTKGHAKGSWYFASDPHADRGGRLFCTSLATMILEVYYRHMPLYAKQASEEDFPL